jgi:hypothetical protein
MTTETAKKVAHVKVTRDVPVEIRGDVFRCFVSPAVRLGLKRLRVGIAFEMETSQDQPLDEQNPTLMMMREAARQLGLEMGEQ